MYINYPTELQRLRKQANLSQKQLADALHVSQTAVGFWERGERTPSVDIATKISDYFNVPMDTLFKPARDDFSLGKLDVCLSNTTLHYDRENELIQVSRALDSKGQKKLMDYAHDLKQIYPTKKAPNPNR